MIIYDVNSFVKGMDINTWYSLYEKGLIVYDSFNGEKPFVVDADGLSLIDVSEISSDDILKLTEAINGLNDEYAEDQKEVAEIVKRNNQKLIDYLKNLNK